MPLPSVKSINAHLIKRVAKRSAAKGGALALGRLLPFGIEGPPSAGPEAGRWPTRSALRGRRRRWDPSSLWAATSTTPCRGNLTHERRRQREQAVQAAGRPVPGVGADGARPPPDVDVAYENLLADVLTNGTSKSDRTGTGTRSLFARQLRYDLGRGFPRITTSSWP